MKKSKFLKKSLAMLLAVMLVVAMIPLSASAALPNDLQFIYVNDNQVALGSSFTVDVSDQDTGVDIRTNEDLKTEYGYELRVADATSNVTEKAVTNADQNFSFDPYMNGNNQVTLKLYDVSGVEDQLAATYVMTINKVAKNTTTNLASVTPGAGVYSATIDNENKIVNVVLARHNGDDGKADQSAFKAKMTVTPADGATVTSTTVDANDGSTFTVTSESKGNKSTFTVKATYLDALNSFTITGTDGKKYEGVFTDADLDDVVDTITVTLPQSAICDKYGDVITNPSLAVFYAAEGNVTTNVVVGTTGVKSDGSVSVTFTGLEKGTSSVDSVVATRLPATGGAVQFYNLTVQLEKSSNTDITYAQVNSTIADVDLDAKTISAEIPSKEALNNVKVTLKVASTSKVTLDKTTKNGGTVEFTGVDLSSSKIVTVTAQDGTMKQYTLTATHVTNETDADITAFWVKDGDGNTYKASMAGDDDITVTVPYMTSKIDSWNIYVTPASYTYVTNESGTQLINGTSTVAAIIDVKDQVVPVNGELTATMVAINKNDEKITKEYTVHFVLSNEINEGKTLTDLEFTAQPTSNDCDEDLYRSLSDANTFNAEVHQSTNGTNNVGTLNLQVPPSLYEEDDLGIEYWNYVTNFVTRDGGVAFINTTGSTYVPLKALENDDDTVKINASEVKDGGKILVLSEEVARWAMNMQATWDNWSQPYGRINADSSTKYDGHPDDYTTTGGVNANANGKSIASLGTVYEIHIDEADPEIGTELKTFSVGGYDLTIDGDKITGELPFSLTTDTANIYSSAYFANFTMSKYAQLRDDSATYFSNGDIDGDGVVDAIDDNPSDALTGFTGYNNYKFAFVRNADHTVTVYRVDDGATTANAAVKNGVVTVVAEDRLTNGNSSSDYTFDLTWAAPCEDADIESFSLGNFSGVINNDPEQGRTITVNVPYGTDVTGMVATFTTSTGASVVLDTPDGIDFESGVTSVNYTNPVKLYVTSEDKDTTRMYTVTVKQGLTFSDIDENDWFYDDVVSAAENGYVNGMGDGKYEPYGKLTRAQFALMIARAMNYDSNPDVESAFPDVADNHWAKAAINFCYQNEIITGYEDGEFKPDKTITRQEVATILARAFNLEEISSEVYPDDSAIAGWASDYVYMAKAAGLMKGDAGTGKFRPNDTLNRAEAATILMNANRAGKIN